MVDEVREIRNEWAAPIGEMHSGIAWTMDQPHFILDLEEILLSVRLPSRYDSNSVSIVKPFLQTHPLSQRPHRLPTHYTRSPHSQHLLCGSMSYCRTCCAHHCASLWPTQARGHPYLVCGVGVGPTLKSWWHLGH